MSEPQTEAGLISKDSQEFGHMGQEVSRIRSQVSTPFGVREIHILDDSIEGLTKKECIDSIRRQLLGHAGDRVWEHTIGNMIEEVSRNPDLHTQLQRIQYEIKGRQMFNSDLFQIMPYQLLEAVIREHIRQFEIKKRILAGRAENMKAQFHEKLLDFTHAGVIPLSYDEAEERLSKSNILIVDPLHYGKRFIQGIHDAVSHDILISSSLTSHDLAAVLPHELTHVISGRTFLATPHREYVKGLTEIGYPTQLHVQRSGTTLLDRTHDQPRRRFDWLNEGITETLHVNFNPEIIGTRYDTEYYHEEKEIIAFFQKKCGSLDPFLAAYFEDYDSTTPKEQRLTGWNRMVSITNQVFAPGFLAAMDSYVQENGIEKAHATLYRDWREIVAIPIPSDDKKPISLEDFRRGRAAR